MMTWISCGLILFSSVLVLLPSKKSNALAFISVFAGASIISKFDLDFIVLLLISITVFFWIKVFNNAAPERTRYKTVAFFLALGISGATLGSLFYLSQGNPSTVEVSNTEFALLPILLGFAITVIRRRKWNQ